MLVALLVPTLFVATTAAGDDSGKAATARAQKPLGRFEIIPEYARRLGRVLLLVPAATEGEAKRALLLKAAYREILASFPAHTVVEVAVSRADEAFVRDTLATFGGGNAAKVHVVTSDKLDMWAQDVGESVTLEGRPHFLVSARGAASNAYNQAMVAVRSRVAKEVFGNEAAVQTSFVFEGGNWTFDRTEDGLRVFVGYNDVEATILREAERGLQVSPKEVLESISSLLSGAEVVLVGKESQSEYLFHLDQAFVILADATAVVARIDATDGKGKGSREAKQLEEIHRQLEAYGYRTLVIPHTLEDVRHYRSSTNVIPYVEADGGKKLLFPIFPGELREEPRERPLKKEHLTGKARVAFEVFEAAGYAPTPIPDFVSGAGGSIHCVVNVLD